MYASTLAFSGLRFWLQEACGITGVSSGGALAANGLTHGDTVTLLLRVEGGGKADSRFKKSRSRFRWKWKKKRTRRLQRKRRKMRQRSK